MPYAAPRHCPHGHPPFTGGRCPVCTAQAKAAADARRPSARARGYNGAWEKARASFLKAHPHCVACGAPATVVDHRQPHKGDRKLFWDRSNWAPMCASCHGRKTAQHDGGFGRPVAGGGLEFSARAPGPAGEPRAQFLDYWS